MQLGLREIEGTVELKARGRMLYYMFEIPLYREWYSGLGASYENPEASVIATGMPGCFYELPWIDLATMCSENASKRCITKADGETVEFFALQRRDYICGPNAYGKLGSMRQAKEDATCICANGQTCCPGLKPDGSCT